MKVLSPKQSLNFLYATILWKAENNECVLTEVKTHYLKIPSHSKNRRLLILIILNYSNKQ